jgi:hypothetical protein
VERVGRVELRDLQLGRLLDAPCPVYPHLKLGAQGGTRTPTLLALAPKASVSTIPPLGHKTLVPPHRIELRIDDYKSTVIPFNYKGAKLFNKILGEGFR